MASKTVARMVASGIATPEKLDASRLQPWPEAAGDGAAPARPPVVLLACGSFSPITYLHLRMLEQGRDHLLREGFTVLGGFLSPVSDGYKKKGLAPAPHRAAMVRAALQGSDWITGSFWECSQARWTTTYNVLVHHRRQIEEHYGCGEGAVTIVLVCGSDLLDSFNVPNLWSAADMRALLSFGIVVLERAGTDAAKVIFGNDLMYEHATNIRVVKQFINNEVSSTAIRRCIRRGLSIKYLTPDAVVAYIREHNLYTSDDFDAGAAAAAAAAAAGEARARAIGTAKII